MRVLICPDKFKGTLTASEAANAIAQGWCRVRPRDNLQLMPISDGGDGFGAVLGGYLQAEARCCSTLDAAHRPRRAGWWWAASPRIALIESAEVIGLAHLPPGKFHPSELDTFGLGRLFHEVAALGPRECLIGIGGSATNDGGFGLARALGWRFLDRAGALLNRWTELTSLESLHPPENRVGPLGLTVAVDVQNPLLGPAGATRIYGPQKGLRSEDFEKAEACLDQLARVAQREGLGPPPSLPGTGAAGGLGFGLASFLGARLEPGFRLVAREMNLEQHVSGVDLVVTGEGAIDASTWMGKGVGQLADLCRTLGVPCYGLAGKLVGTEPIQARQPLFAGLQGITPDLARVEETLASPGRWLAVLAGKLAEQLQPSGRAHW